MPTIDEMKQIAKEHENTFLKINRVPFKTKILFTEIAEEDFAGDFGLFLREILFGWLEYQKVKECLFDKEYLNYLVESKNIEKKETSVKKRKTFSDKIEEMKGGVK